MDTVTVGALYFTILLLYMFLLSDDQVSRFLIPHHMRSSVLDCDLAETIIK